MKKTLISVLLTSAIMIALPTLAQEVTNEKPIVDPIPLELRYEDCINNPACTAQEQWQIMDEMHNQMHQTFRDMNRTCRDMDYRNCFEPSVQEREQWHKMHAHMREMMENMESRSDNRASEAEEMQQEEPAAGDEERNEPWWKRWFWRDGRKENMTD